uniref:Uncharacterized protein n=1 Tax=Oryza rufipogon TaxID=4529 RepID=A0A0E0NLF0_ORYRU
MQEMQAPPPPPILLLAPQYGFHYQPTLEEFWQSALVSVPVDSEVRKLFFGAISEENLEYCIKKREDTVVLQGASHNEGNLAISVAD